MHQFLVTFLFFSGVYLIIVNIARLGFFLVHKVDNLNFTANAIVISCVWSAFFYITKFLL